MAMLIILLKEKSLSEHGFPVYSDKPIHIQDIPLGHEYEIKINHNEKKLIFNPLSSLIGLIEVSLPELEEIFSVRLIG